MHIQWVMLPLSGYVYQVLIEFSYESADNSQHLVDYLTKRLQRPSPHGKVDQSEHSILIISTNQV